MTRSAQNSSIPLKSEEVVLKQLTLGDISDSYVGWLNNPEVNQFLEIRHQLPLDKEAVEQFVSHCLATQRHLWGIFVEGRHVGNISCSVYKLHYQWVDVSILVGENDYRGRGLGKIAMAGAVEYLFSKLNLHRIQAGAYSNNDASIQLFSRLGFKTEGIQRESVVLHGEYLDGITMGILKPEWDQVKASLPKSQVIPAPWEQ